MSTLYPPYFKAAVEADGDTDEYVIKHNCNGSIDFMAEAIVDAETYRLIQMAFRAGERARSKEFRGLLGMEN